MVLVLTLVVLGSRSTGTTTTTIAEAAAKIVDLVGAFSNSSNYRHIDNIGPAISTSKPTAATITTTTVVSLFSSTILHTSPSTQISTCARRQRSSLVGAGQLYYDDYEKHNYHCPVAVVDCETTTVENRGLATAAAATNYESSSIAAIDAFVV